MEKMIKKGKYIVIEGGEGCGKTTQSQLIYDYLVSKGINSILTREPGGVEEAEKIREILKDKANDLHPLTELFLFEAARTEFFRRVVVPNLKHDVIVISDRSGYSTEAYQGYAGEQDLNLIRHLNNLSTFDTSPDLAIIIDINPRVELIKEVVNDRFSQKGLEYHIKVRKGFLEVAKRNKNCRVVSYKPGNIKGTHREIRDYVERLINA